MKSPIAFFLLIFILACNFPSIAWAGYEINISAENEAKTEDEPLPDISGYTTEHIIKKIPPLKKGSVSVQPMHKAVALRKFFQKNQKELFQKKQNRSTPVAIFISSGVYDLERLHNTLKSNIFLDRESNNTYTLKVPLYIAPKATLIVQGTDAQRTQLRLSSNHGAFISNRGNLFAVNTSLVAWKDGAAHTYKKSTEFRPFIVSWSASHTWMAQSYIGHLGYAGAKSYGISLSANSNIFKDNSKPRPKGRLVDNIFEGLYYGFYCYEADDIAIINNIYKDNIIYGIDPHDRSNRLIIAKNEAYGTKKKHGIIVSREVDHSFIFDNYSHHNRGSGIMIDRSSIHNIVANNRSVDNNNDGITIYESPHTHISGNTVENNGKHGVRIRNSWNISLQDNMIANNRGVGLQVYTADISSQATRDFKLDPFTQKASASLHGDTISANKQGGFKLENIEEVSMHDIKLLYPSKQMFRGDMSNHTTELLQGLIVNKGVSITKEKN